jgi:hypothetical protein
MSILLPPKPLPGLREPIWLPGPDHPALPVDELHIWRARLEGSHWGSDGWEDCPVSRDWREKLKTSLFRKNIVERYGGTEDELPGILKGPASGLRVVMAQCDHLALIAISRDVRGVGLDVERVREDIPIDEMADGFLDAHSQWDLRVTWSQQEKAWKFFQFWTSNEACAQARPSQPAALSCQVRGFSPEAEFVAALAVEGGPEAGVWYWDWS